MARKIGKDASRMRRVWRVEGENKGSRRTFSKYGKCLVDIREYTTSIWQTTKMGKIVSGKEEGRKMSAG